MDIAHAQDAAHGKNRCNVESSENKMTLSPCYIRVEDDKANRKELAAAAASRNFSDKGL